MTRRQRTMGADDSGEKGKEASARDDEDEDDEDESTQPVGIDFDGLAARVARVPVPADNYGGLSAIEGHLLYARGGPFYYGRESDVKTDLRIFSLKDREESTLAEGISGLRPLRRRLQSPGAAGSRVQAVRREAERRRQGQARCHGGPEGRSRAG